MDYAIFMACLIFDQFFWILEDLDFTILLLQICSIDVLKSLF